MTPVQLKNSILQLAIEGKLVEQRKEEYVSTALFNAKKNTDMEILGFEIPNNWELSTIEGIANIISTKKYQIRESEILKDGLYPVISQSKEAVIGYSNEKNKLLVINKPVIIFGDHTTIVKYIDFDFVVGADGIKIFEPISDIDPKFFKYTIDFLSIGLEKKGGYSRHYKFIKHLSLPVPPLAEQKRIVEKIEELLPLVDRYEKAWTRLEELNKKFPLDMQKSILQEAIQGKLVEQRKEEGTGEELFKEIQEEKQKLTSEGKLKRQKVLPEITEDEIPFDIPETWKWCYIGDVFNHISGKALNSKNTKGIKHKYITTSNVYWDSFKLDNLKEMYYTEDEIEKYSLKLNDLLVLEGGDVGRAAIWNLTETYCFQNHIHRLRPFLNVSIKYFYYNFIFLKNKNAIEGKGIGIKGLSSGALHRIIIPLPPLAEQKRIVEKIEELLPLCEKLK